MVARNKLRLLSNNAPPPFERRPLRIPFRAFGCRGSGLSQTLLFQVV